MCTRYCSTLKIDDWARLYDLAKDGPPAPWNFQPNYNVAITETIPVVMLRDGKRVLERMRWWLIPWFHKGTIKEWKRATYNTRSDNVDAATWRGIWQKNRCLIPVSGFYEWYHTPGAKKGTPPQPYYFTAADGSPALAIAGIFDRWKDPEQDGRELLSCSMMTTDPNEHVKKVHDRLVLTLRPDQFASWLDGSAGKEMLVPAPEDMIRYWPVSKRINNVRVSKEDKTLIEPVELEGPSTLV